MLSRPVLHTGRRRARNFPDQAGERSTGWRHRQTPPGPLYRGDGLLPRPKFSRSRAFHRPGHRENRFHGEDETDQGGVEANELAGVEGRAAKQLSERKGSVGTLDGAILAAEILEKTSTRFLGIDEEVTQ